MKRSYLSAAIFSAVFASSAACGAEAPNVDWSKIPAAEITLLYPGQSSWEWIISAAHKAGATGAREGKNCRECHADEEKDIGDLIVSGKKLEPHPIAGKPGSLKIAIQAAFDNDNLYLRANWADDGKAGVHFPAYIFKGGKWEHLGDHRADEAVAAGKQPAVYEDRLAFLIADTTVVPEFKAAGCWAICHNDMAFMPDHPKTEEIAAHPFWGKKGKKKSEIRKYLGNTRNSMDATGGWKNPIGEEQYNAILDKGYFLDLFQWRAARSNPVGLGEDGFVSNYRNTDAGKKTYSDNWDKEKKQPKWMFKGDKPTLTAADLTTPANLLLESDAVPFDAAVAAKEGAVLPQVRVTGKVEGSVADIGYAKGEHDGKAWTVVMARKLATGNKDDVQMAAGQTYTLGIAVHDGDAAARWHFISLPVTLSLGKGDGVINAISLK